MINNLIFCILLIVGCGNSGIEGYVNEPITITAEQPEDEIDYDYFWALSNQPDGSLMNSNDLVSTNDGNKMTFIPDYPGDYSIEVIISEYGDEISNQIFNFSVQDYKEEDLKEINENTKNDIDEDWLNDNIEDAEVEDSKKEYFEEKNIELESKTILIKKDKPKIQSKTTSNKKSNLEIENKTNYSPSAKVLNKREVPLRSSNIAERTDRFTIQITSKKMLKDAQLFSQELIKKGYDAYIQKVVFKSNETFYRVRIGSYDNHNSAKIAADELSKDLGMTAWVDFVRKEQ